MLIDRGHDAEAVDRAIQILHRRQLVDASDPEDLLGAPADISLPTLATALERQARAARLVAGALAHANHAARADLDVPGPTAYVDRCTRSRRSPRSPRRSRPTSSAACSR